MNGDGQRAAKPLLTRLGGKDQEPGVAIACSLLGFLPGLSVC